jgi:hypothetical protein
LGEIPLVAFKEAMADTQHFSRMFLANKSLQYIELFDAILMISARVGFTWLTMGRYSDTHGYRLIKQG